VSVREVRAAGLEALMLATELLQRARRADPRAGLWEAADVQWWWRKPRRSDDVEKLFWIDDEGPVAGVLLTSETTGAWQCDPVVVPRASGLDPGVVWRQTQPAPCTKVLGSGGRLHPLGMSRLSHHVYAINFGQGCSAGRIAAPSRTPSRRCWPGRR
jgi:hypothetical protein